MIWYDLALFSLVRRLCFVPRHKYHDFPAHTQHLIQTYSLTTRLFCSFALLHTHTHTHTHAHTHTRTDRYCVCDVFRPLLLPLPLRSVYRSDARRRSYVDGKQRENLPRICGQQVVYARRRLRHRVAF